MLKKTLTIAAALTTVIAGRAQNTQSVQDAAAAAAAALTQAPKTEIPVEKPRYWTSSADFSIGFSQTGLWNWAAGGYNTITLAASVDAKADYAKELLGWNNRLQLDYGFLWSADKKNLLQKSTDRIYFESKLAYKTGADSKWNYTASYDFRTQFSNSYEKYEEDPQTGKWQGQLKSGFMSPGYTDLALGMEWKPAHWFDMNIAPLTGGFTIVTNPELRATYGMKLSSDGVNYNSALFQFGAQIKLNAKVSINDAFNYDTQVVLFTDYLNCPFRENRVNWDNKFTWQAARFFKIALSTWLIYDPIVSFDGVVSKVQFKEFLSISFNYTLSNKK